MSDVLYRKYRSRTFAEVQGQSVIVSVIRHSFSSGNFSHAYLFAGPRGTGKTTMARLVAKAANCPVFADTGDVCNACATCMAVESGNNIDVIEIDAASNRGIEEIRQLKDNINFLPTIGKFKVYIVDEAHMLTREAFNALLKTLEEPPKHVIFVLATTEPHKIPLTILSRVQRFDFRLATSQELSAKLSRILETEGYSADQGVLDLIYTYSEGSYRDAESLLGKIFANSQGENKISIGRAEELLGIPPSSMITDYLHGLLGGNVQSQIDLLDRAQGQGVDIGQLVKQLILSLRNNILAEVAAKTDYSCDLQILGSLIGLQSELKIVDNGRLLLEILALKYSQDHASASEFSKKVPPVSGDGAVEVSQTEQLPAKARSHAKKNTKGAKAEAEKTGDGRWAKLLTEIKKVDFKLWTIFKACKPQLDGEHLLLGTAYQLNVETLQNLDVLSKIQPLINMVYPGIELNVVLDGVPPKQIQTTDADIPFDPEPDLLNVSLVEEIL